MAVKPHSMIGRGFHKRTLAQWRAAVAEAPTAALETLRHQRQQVRELLVPLHDMAYLADTRLTLPRIGTQNFSRPIGTDWAWRPQLWSGVWAERGLAPATDRAMLGTEVTIFHDCAANEIMLRQTRNSREDDLAAFAVSVEVFQFTGSYFSLAIAVPEAACQGLTRNQVIHLGLTIEREQPVGISARLNVKHGPNTEQMVQLVPDDRIESTVSFDLAYTELNERRVETMWIDLMFDKPQMNRISVRDLNICRAPRAGM